MIERVSIPYENGNTLPGDFMRADAARGPRPTLMIIGVATRPARNFTTLVAAPLPSAAATTRFFGKVPVKSAPTPWIQL
jgi:hypothetical protein